MSNTLICTLCENHCLLSSLGCMKGKRFYEQTTEAYCTLCENHCVLHDLKCQKGIDFYGKIDKESWLAHEYSEEINVVLEQCFHQFNRARGGMTSQMRILSFVYNHGWATQKIIQDAIGIKSAAVSEMIAKLVDLELVVTDKAEEDKRKKVIKLTEKGKDVVVQKRKYEDELKLFSCLSCEEKNVMVFLIQRLMANWNERKL